MSAQVVLFVVLPLGTVLAIIMTLFAYQQLVARARLGSREEARDAPGAIVWPRLANMVEGGIAVGGRLDLDSETLIFTPNGFESRLGRERAVWRLLDVTHVDVADRSWNLMAGGLRKRLVVTSSGESIYFVVSKAQLVAASLRERVLAHDE